MFYFIYEYSNKRSSFFGVGYFGELRACLFVYGVRANADYYLLFVYAVHRRLVIFFSSKKLKLKTFAREGIHKRKD